MHNAAPNSRQEQPQSPSPPKMSSNQSQDQQRSKVQSEAQSKAQSEEAGAEPKQSSPAFAQAAIDSIHQAMLNKKDAPYGDRKKMVNDWRLRWHPDKRRSDN